MSCIVYPHTKLLGADFSYQFLSRLAQVLDMVLFGLNEKETKWRSTGGQHFYTMQNHFRDMDEAS